MIPIFEFLKLAEALLASGVDYALCGGLAVAVHGYPRNTRDIDILVLEADLTSVQAVVRSVGFSILGGPQVFKPGQPEEMRLFRLNKVLDTEMLTLDMLFVTPVLQDVWDSRVWMDIRGMKLCVVSKEGIKKMKRLAGRTQDLADIEALDSTQGDEHDD
jgi:hypothetical protein